MEIGTAIFLSTVLISIVLLYIFSGNRNRWIRFLKWLFAIIILGLLSLVVGLYLWKLWEERRYPVTSLMNISLGDTVRDAIFKKGEPNERCYVNKTTREIISLVYFDGQRRIDIFFYRGNAFEIIISGTVPFYETGARVAIGDTIDKVEKIWGNPDYIRENSPGDREFTYEEFNLGFFSKYNKITRIEIYSSHYTNAINELSEYPVMYCVDKEGRILREVKQRQSEDIIIK